jgi:hypothetical protein
LELGGESRRTLADYLADLRAARGRARALRLTVPSGVAYVASRLCDVLHFSPYSLGHLELLRRDNVPARADAARLLGRPPRAVADRSAGAGLRHALRRPTAA